MRSSADNVHVYTHTHTYTLGLTSWATCVFAYPGPSWLILYPQVGGETRQYVLLRCNPSRGDEFSVWIFSGKSIEPDFLGSEAGLFFHYLPSHWTADNL
jgi:hypothetical protein